MCPIVLGSTGTRSLERPPATLAYLMMVRFAASPFALYRYGHQRKVTGHEMAF